MATFRAEDVVIGIDGRELAAQTVSFQSSSSRAETRRYGKIIDPTGLVINGPQTSSMTIDFLITGSGSATSNPILDLLSGIDLEITSSPTYPSFEGIYKPYNTGEIYIQQNGADTINYFLWNEPTETWSGVFQHEYVAAAAITVTDDLLHPDTISAMSPAMGMERAGFMGCLTGSTISFGGQPFASGAALTNLSIGIQPFSPITCSASFDIYNPVTGEFITGTGSFSIHPKNVAHGLYSTYSGVFTNVDEVESINITYSAERVARYEIGKKNVNRIDTKQVQKTIEFAGYGRSETLEQPTLPFTITLGSENQSNIYTDTVSGVLIDDSFAIPNVGIISKQVKIVQNIV